VPALKLLGLNARELVKLKPDQIFLKIVDALGKLDNHFEKVLVLQKIFDSEGVKFAQIATMGAKGIEELGKKMEEAGQIMSRAQIDKVVVLNDSVTRLTTAWKAFSDQLTVSLAGPMSKALDWATSMLDAYDKVRKGILPVANSFSSGAMRAFADIGTLGGRLPNIGLPAMLRSRADAMDMESAQFMGLAPLARPDTNNGEVLETLKSIDSGIRSQNLGVK